MTAAYTRPGRRESPSPRCGASRMGTATSRSRVACSSGGSELAGCPDVAAGHRLDRDGGSAGPSAEDHVETAVDRPLVPHRGPIVRQHVEDLDDLLVPELMPLAIREVAFVHLREESLAVAVGVSPRGATTAPHATRPRPPRSLPDAMAPTAANTANIIWPSSPAITTAPITASAAPTNAVAAGMSGRSSGDGRANRRVGCFGLTARPTTHLAAPRVTSDRGDRSPAGVVARSLESFAVARRSGWSRRATSRRVRPARTGRQARSWRRPAHRRVGERRGSALAR